MSHLLLRLGGKPPHASVSSPFDWAYKAAWRDKSIQQYTHLVWMVRVGVLCGLLGESVVVLHLLLLLDGKRPTCVCLVTI